MLKKIILAGIVGLSLQAVATQAEAQSRITNTEVTVSGAGGMCRSVTITAEGNEYRRTRQVATLGWDRAARKVVHDYRTTHRASSVQLQSSSYYPHTSGYYVFARGQVCFVDR